MENETYPDKEDCKTGYICSKTGRYFCELHPAIAIVGIEGKEFPRCHQGAGHRTTWIYEEKY